MRNRFWINSLISRIRPILGGAVAIFVVMTLLAVDSQPASAVVLGATITVNSTLDTVGDEGICTLFEAITAANANSASGTTLGECAAGTTGLDTINFDSSIFNSDKTINTGGLPAIIAPVIITGEGPAGLIKVNGPGTSAGSVAFGFQPGSAGSVLNKLLVTNWTYGADLAGGKVTVTNSRFGLDFTGTSVEPNTFGIRIGSSNNLIGGLDASGNPRRNIISGNGSIGIFVSAGTNNAIQGNWIGTNISGNAAVGNSVSGVRVNSAAVGTKIGGLNPWQGNVISGNPIGVEILAGAKTTTLVRNFIGLGEDGGSSVGNTSADVVDNGGVGTMIGGTMPQAGNFLVYSPDGIMLNTASIPGSVTISGNIIGRDATDSPAGNTAGIEIVTPPLKTTIKGNVIGSNLYGINFGSSNPVASVSQNCISGNVTYGALNGGSVLNIHGNWWGSASGPNPPGSGDITSGSFVVSPWLTAPPTSCLGYSTKSVTPKDQALWNKKTTPTTLMWNKVPTAATYDWALYKDGSLFDFDSAVSAPPYPSVGVLDYAMYRWHVTTHAPDHIDWASQFFTFYVTIQKLPKPGAVVVPNAGAITFSWNAFPSASVYNLEVFPVSDCTSGGTPFPGSTTSQAVNLPFTTGSYSWFVKPDTGPQMPCQNFSVP